MYFCVPIKRDEALKKDSRFLHMLDSVLLIIYDDIFYKQKREESGVRKKCKKDS